MVGQGNKFYNKGYQRQTSWQVWALTWFFLSEEIHQWEKKDVIVDDNRSLTSMCLSA